MMTLPPEFQQQISEFSAVFRKRTWQKAMTLITGAILCPGSRTVCNVLRMVGLSQDKAFCKYHRVLNKAKWSAMSLSLILMRALTDFFVGPDDPLVFGIDETIERRWGPKIKKRGIYRDPVRSSASHFVKCSGLRWMSVMLLNKLPWLDKRTCWALPFLTALCPSEGYYEKRSQSRRHKKLTDWARQLIIWLARYASRLRRPVYLAGDGSYATYELLDCGARHGVHLIARMRLDSRLFHLPPKKRPPGTTGPKPKIGKRLLCMEKRLCDKRIKWSSAVFSEWYGKRDKRMLFTSGTAIWYKPGEPLVHLRWVLVKDPEGQLEPVLLSCTDLSLPPEKIIAFFVRRWRVEVTFQEVRRHLGVETQRQWSDLAIARSTPVLMALFSIVCLFARRLQQEQQISAQDTAWYKKQGLTFSDILAAVRARIWRQNQLSTSGFKPEVDNYRETIRFLWSVLANAAA
jgi:hypothetical protein